MTRLIGTSVDNLREAARLILEGGLIAYPTDTVYGLGCNPFDVAAVDRLVKAKQRVKGSLPILVSSFAEAERVGEINEKSTALASKFWPGPLTLVVPTRSSLPAKVTDNSQLVGLRIPNHEATRRLIHEFNLLLSSARGNEREANHEICYLLRELGDSSPKTDFALVSGLTVAKTSLDPVKVVSKLRPVLKYRPWQFRYILKVKPVEEVVPCDIPSIGAAVVNRAGKVGVDETFRVSLEKRRSRVSSKDIIDAVASKVPRKVELRNPDKIVLIEVIGDVAGVSVISPHGILGIEREKRRL